VGNVGKWTLALALCGAACAKSQGADPGKPIVGAPDAGIPDPGPVDAGTPDPAPTAVKPVFGTPGPWAMGKTTGSLGWPSTTYGSADGIQESPVVGVSTDEPVLQPDGSISQNLWVATNSALYLLRPGDKKFTRFDGHDGLHLPGFPAESCDDASGTLKPCPSGEAASPGINEIVGGGSGDGYIGEVFVGYYGYHDWSRSDDGTWTDPWRHSGKLDRVRLKADTSGKLTIEVIRFDMVSNATVEFWHNKTVYKMVYDHRIHPHELYVGTDHGVTKFSPDKWKPNDPPPDNWFLGKNNAPVWMSDHLHPRACFHKICTDDSGLRLGGWRGLAIDDTGDLWVAGRYAAGKIRYVADNAEWWVTPRKDGMPAQTPSFGDPYEGNCSGNRPVFCVPQEGDYVNLSAVALTKDGTVWFTSGVLFGHAEDVNYGIASWAPRKPFTYYDPIRDVGMAEENVRDMLALPDGRLVLAGPNTGLTVWEPATGKRTSIRAGQGIPDDHVLRIQLDTMVDPPALHVATRGGAAVLRVLP
jgi:hypothetical protein